MTQKPKNSFVFLKTRHKLNLDSYPGSRQRGGVNAERILQGLVIFETQKRDKNHSLLQISDYYIPNVSDKVVQIILSYTDYINRVVWS